MRSRSAGSPVTRETLRPLPEGPFRPPRHGLVSQKSSFLRDFQPSRFFDYPHCPAARYGNSQAEACGPRPTASRIDVDVLRPCPVSHEVNLMKRISMILSILCAVAVSMMFADTASAAGRGRRGQKSCDCAPACASEPACCAAAEPACCAAEPACGAAEPACCAAEPACCAAEPACCASGSAPRRARRGLFSSRRASRGGSASSCTSCCEEPACSAEPCCNAG